MLNKGVVSSSSVCTRLGSDPDRTFPLTSTLGDVIESRCGSSRRKMWIKYGAYVVQNPVPESCVGSQ